MQDLNINIEEYRETAEFLRDIVLDKLGSFSEALSVPIIGDMYNFPNLDPTGKTINLQINLLQEQVNEAISTLETLAVLKEMEEAKKEGLEVSPFLKDLMEFLKDLMQSQESEVKFFLDFAKKYNHLKNIEDNNEIQKRYSSQKNGETRKK